MENYKIGVGINIVKCGGSEQADPKIYDEGSFGMIISGRDAVSIDRCGNAILNTACQAMRKAASEHFTRISEEKAAEKYPGGILTENGHPYQADGEIGRFTFTTHTVISEEGEEYDTAKDLFAALKGNEWYKTESFKEIAIVYGDTEPSYGKTGKLINRIRYQEEGGTPFRTLKDATESEGLKLVGLIEKKRIRYRKITDSQRKAF
jgi:hypothetical protein